MIRFLEENGYDVSYISEPTSIATVRCCSTTSSSSPAATTSTGRASSARTSQAARDAGVNLAFFSGNEIFWKTRWAAEHRRLQHAVPDAGHLQGDALRRARPIRRIRRPGPGAWARSAVQPAGRRRAARERAHRPGVRRQLRDRRHHGPVAVQQAAVLAQHRGRQPAAGQTLTLGAGHGTLGYEWDVDADNGFRPAGEFDLSSTTVSGVAAVHRLRQHDRHTAPRPTT